MTFRLQSFLALALLLCTAPAVAQTKPAARPVQGAPRVIAPFTVWQLRHGDTVETQVTSTQLNPSGYWLMLYVNPTSKASMALLDHLQSLAAVPAATLQVPEPKPKLDASRLVIIADHSTGAELSQFELKYPDLTAATWTHDSHGEAAHLLGIHGTPHLFGMRDGMQHWQLAANLKPADIEPALTTWAGFNSLPKNKLTRRKSTLTPPANPPASATTASPSGTAPPSAPAKGPQQ